MDKHFFVSSVISIVPLFFLRLVIAILVFDLGNRHFWCCGNDFFGLWCCLMVFSFILPALQNIPLFWVLFACSLANCFLCSGKKDQLCFGTLI